MTPKPAEDRVPSHTTREDRIYLHFRALRRRWDWRRSSKSALLMHMARYWRTPIREIKAIVACRRGSDGPASHTFATPEDALAAGIRVECVVRPQDLSRGEYVSADGRPDPVYFTHDNDSVLVIYGCGEEHPDANSRSDQCSVSLCHGQKGDDQ